MCLVQVHHHHLNSNNPIVHLFLAGNDHFLFVFSSRSLSCTTMFGRWWWRNWHHGVRLMAHCCVLRANRLGGCCACSMKLLQQLHRSVLFIFPLDSQNPWKIFIMKNGRFLSPNNQLRPLKMTGCAFPWVLYSILLSKNLDKLGGPYYDRNIWSYRARAPTYKWYFFNGFHWGSNDSPYFSGVLSPKPNAPLGDGFKHFFSPYLGEIIQFD